jgi:hypothetical protein
MLPLILSVSKPRPVPELVEGELVEGGRQKALHYDAE